MSPDNPVLAPGKTVLMWLPGFDTRAEEDVEFRLVYEGNLFAENEGRSRNPHWKEARAKHKHEIRKDFHRQLKKLWQTHPGLKSYGHVRSHHYGDKNHLDFIADNFSENGFRFVPLATRANCLLCKIDILMLRPGAPGSVIVNPGDLDNRLKTLFDALKRPQGKNELGGYLPEADENPFFCLLEDDGLITHAVVETDTLLNPKTTNISEVIAVISVSVRPYGGPVASEIFL